MPEPTTCPAGFLANGVRAGIKASGRPDLAIVLCPGGASAAAMLTRNRAMAAPLQLSAAHLATSAGEIRALLINAGCANAATGAEGHRRAARGAEAVAARVGCRGDQVLTNSTGVIGVQLPIERIEAAMEELVGGASVAGLPLAADAILTTDTRRKTHEVRGQAVHGGDFRVVGFAKGAGMIHPDLRTAVPHATMIAVLLTDAAIEPQALQAMLAGAAEGSFQRISIDGDTSTNDAVFALASGVAGRVDASALQRALGEVCEALAEQIVRDGEGARKLITVSVVGAATAQDALTAARTVAMSLLVRTAVAGGDPNWGRILAALGRSGADLALERLRVGADGVVLFQDGGPVEVPRDRRSAVFAGPDVAIEIDLDLGAFADRFRTCDLTEEYVRVNAEYTT